MKGNPKPRKDPVQGRLRYRQDFRRAGGIFFSTDACQGSMCAPVIGKTTGSAIRS